MTQFANPYFVTPHAVQRFQQRIANIPAVEIINLIQAWLQGKPEPVEWQEWKKELCPIYRFRFNGKPVYIPVRPGEKRWPAIPTILGPESRLHRQVMKDTFTYYTLADIAYFLNIDRTTVMDWVDQGLICGKKKGIRHQISRTAFIYFLRTNQDKWNAAKLQVDVFEFIRMPAWYRRKLEQDGKFKNENKSWRDHEIWILRNNYQGNTKDMAKLLKRSPASIRVKACRLRKEGMM